MKDIDVREELNHVKKVIEGKILYTFSPIALFVSNTLSKMIVDGASIKWQRNVFENKTNFIIAATLVAMLIYYLYMITNLNLKQYTKFENHKAKIDKHN